MYFRCLISKPCECRIPSSAGLKDINVSIHFMLIQPCHFESFGRDAMAFRGFEDEQKVMWMSDEAASSKRQASHGIGFFLGDQGDHVKHRTNDT